MFVKNFVRVFGVLLLILAMSNKLEADDDQIRRDFSKILQTMRDKANVEKPNVKRRNWMWEYRLFKKAASQLARRHGKAAIEFLKKPALADHPHEDRLKRRLALMTLAQIDHERAKQFLSEHLRIKATNKVNWDALVALSYMPPERARSLLNSWVDKLPGEYGYRVSSAIGHLAAVLGDLETLDKLNALQKRLREENYGELVRSILKYPIQSLKQRVEAGEDELTRRLKSERLFWQALNEGPILHRNTMVRYSVIPARMTQQGHNLDSKFLIEKIEECPVEKGTTRSTQHSCAHMAMGLLAAQHPKIAVTKLRKLTKGKGAKAKMVRQVLATIQTRE